jgi:hypothetical protein
MTLPAVQPRVRTSRARLFGPPRWPGRQPPGEDQDQDRAQVVIVSTGERVPASAVSRAVALSGGRPVGVMSLARIHRMTPGGRYTPEPDEIRTHSDVVGNALTSIERAGCSGWGQAGASRSPERAIARVARARGARHVVVIVPAQPRSRRVLAGQMIRELGRWLAPGIAIEAISP